MLVFNAQVKSVTVRPLSLSTSHETLSDRAVKCYTDNAIGNFEGFAESQNTFVKDLAETVVP